MKCNNYLIRALGYQSRQDDNAWLLGLASKTNCNQHILHTYTSGNFLDITSLLSTSDLRPKIKPTVSESIITVSPF